VNEKQEDSYASYESEYDDEEEFESEEYDSESNTSRDPKWVSFSESEPHQN
jgi:hypothetical protein